MPPPIEGIAGEGSAGAGIAAAGIAEGEAEEAVKGGTSMGIEESAA